MKVKNIMFSGFAAAILMGVAAEANAVTAKVVASKGYVDAVTGQLGDLEGAASGKANLVDAVNVKLDPMDALNDAVPEGKFYAGVAQSAEGKVSVVHKDLATRIAGGVMIAPTTDAVNTAIEGVRGEIPTDVQGEIEDGEYSTTTGFFNKVTQTNGKVSVEEKAFDTAVNASTGTHTDTAPTTQAVYQAIEGVRGEIPTNVQTAIEDGSTTATAGFFNKVTQTNGKVSVEEKAFDTAVNASTGTHTDTAPSTKAVYDAIRGIPVMPTACQETGVVCVLSSEDGNYMWSVLAQPYDYTSGDESVVTDGITAQKQHINTNVN